MKVGDLMAKEVGSVGPSDTMDAVARIMLERACGCVPVVDQRSRIVGIVTDRDVCMAALRLGKPLNAIRAEQGMSTEVFTCMPLDGVLDAEHVMRVRQVRRLPVVDADDRLVGLLSLDDIALEAFRERDLLARPVTAGEVGETLAAICRPRVRR